MNENRNVRALAEINDGTLHSKVYPSRPQEKNAGS